MTTGRARVVGAVAVAILAGLWAHRRPFPDAIARLKMPPDSASVVVRRAMLLRPFVPPQGTVGYINGAQAWPESLVPPFDPAVVQLLVRYKLTQYALAPTLVLRGENAPIVIDDFSKAMPDTFPLSHRGPWEVRDVGDGLMLLQRRPAP